MWAYSILGMTVLISIGSCYKKLKNYNVVNIQNRLNLSKLKNNSNVQLATDERRMTYLLSTISAIGVALLWMNDANTYYLLKSIAVFILSGAVAELVLSQQKYALYYNSNAFAYRGRYFRYKDIKAIGYSKLFFQPGKIYLHDGQTYVCFKKGCDVIHEMYRKKYEKISVSE